MNRKTAILLFLFFTNLNLQGQSMDLGVNGFQFVVRDPNLVRVVDGLFEETNQVQGGFVGGHITWNSRSRSYGGGHHSSRSYANTSSFHFGMGVSRVNYQKQTQGVFPETNQYGLAFIKGQNTYWSFPISMYRMIGNHSRIKTGFWITYFPSILASSKTNISTFGGAAMSNYILNYRDNNQVFQHSLLFSIGSQFVTKSGNLYLDVDPFFGFGTSYFKSEHLSISSMSFGMNLNVGFEAPGIDMNIDHHMRDNRTEKKRKRQEEKKKMLEKKQNDINEHLKTQPK